MNDEEIQSKPFSGFLPRRTTSESNPLWRVMQLLIPYRGKLIIGNLLLIAASTLAGFTAVSLGPLLKFCMKPDTSSFTAMAHPEASADKYSEKANSEKPTERSTLDVVMEDYPVVRHAAEAGRTLFAGVMAWAAEGPRRFILAYSLVIILLLFLQGAIQFLGQYSVSCVGVAVSSDLMRLVYANVLGQEMTFFDRRATGRLLKTSFQEIFQMREMVTLLGSTRPILPFRMLIQFAWLLVISVKLSLLLVFLLPVVILPTLLLTRRLKRSWEEEIATEAGPLVIMTEVYQNIQAVKAYGAERLEERYMEPTVCEFIQQTQKRRLAEALITPVVDVLNTLVLFAVFISAYLVFPDFKTIPTEKLLIFMLMTSRFYKPFRALMTMSVRMARAQLVSKRVFALLDRKTSIADAPDAVDFPSDWREIVFDAVSLNYTVNAKGMKRRRRGLRGVRLAIHRGESVAMVGPNGSGKSSFVNLLCRLYDPTSGEIRVGSVALNRIRLASLRQSVCLISQRPILFDRSVAENIAYGLEGVSRERIEAAARAMLAHEFISNLPDGYDTLVGEHGKLLSGGEQQKIALARAALRNPHILILDEPTTGLDPESKAEFLNLVLSMREQGITIIYITHALEEVGLFERAFQVSKEHRVSPLHTEKIGV